MNNFMQDKKRKKKIIKVSLERILNQSIHYIDHSYVILHYLSSGSECSHHDVITYVIHMEIQSIESSKVRITSGFTKF